MVRFLVCLQVVRPSPVISTVTAAKSRWLVALIAGLDVVLKTRGRGARSGYRWRRAVAG